MHLRHLLAACLCLATALPAGAQTLRRDQGPVNFPPASFTGTQFADNRGCVYIRAGFDGAVTWVPRVGRDRRVLCGQTPTFGGRSTAEPQAAPVAEAPRPAATRPRSAGAPKETVASNMDSRPAPVRRSGKPAWLTRTPSPAGPPTLVSAPDPAPATDTPAAAPRTTAVVLTQPRVRTTIPVVREVRTHTTTPVVTEYRAPAPVVVTKPAPQSAPVVMEVSPMARACPNRSSFSQRFTNSVGVRCGPQAEDPVRGSNVYTGTQSASKGKGLNLGGKPAVLRIEGAVADVPKGYKPVFTDGRHNPHRGLPGGAAGFQSSGQVTRSGGVLPYVQAGTFGVASNASNAANRLRSLGLPVTTQSVRRNGRPLTVVLAGPFRDAISSSNALDRVRSAGFRDAFARR